MRYVEKNYYILRKVTKLQAERGHPFVKLENKNRIFDCYPVPLFSCVYIELIFSYILIIGVPTLVQSTPPSRLNLKLLFLFNIIASYLYCKNTTLFFRLCFFAWNSFTETVMDLLTDIRRGIKLLMSMVTTSKTRLCYNG